MVEDCCPRKTLKLRNKAEKREGYLGSERIECGAVYGIQYGSALHCTCHLNTILGITLKEKVYRRKGMTDYME
jgi:hypothetical protein